MKNKAIDLLYKVSRGHILLIFALALTLKCSSQNKIEFIQKEDRVDVICDGQLVTSYLHGSHLSKPCLYPVKSPSGEIMTRSFPFKEVEGESTDHKHHTGAYFTYGSKDEVNGDGYWNNKDGTNKIQHVKVIDARGGNGKGRLLTLSHWINSNNQPVLEERRLMEFHSFNDNEYKIDFTINLVAIDTLVHFEDTKEGMFAIRVADWLAENASGTLYNSFGEYLNAEGERTEKNIWGKRSSWVRLQGKKDRKVMGIAIFHHPNSVNYPAYWHARAYGCFAANPIGQYDYQKATGIDNPRERTLTLNPGESAMFKFRMTIYEDSRTKEQFDQDFEDFCK